VSELSRLPAFEDEANISHLIEKVRGGSNSSLGTLLEVFRPSLTQKASADLSIEMQRRMSQSDLVQETMLTACSKFGEFRGGSAAELQGWLIRILESRLVDGIRRHQIAESRRLDQEDQRATVTEIPDPDLSPSGLMVLQEEAARLLSAMQHLPGDAQRLIHLRYVENQTFETIAQDQGVSVATIWRRFQDATRTLHLCLKQ
jgi:RNA polymerase sigma-70 factor (ECF subfamily)